MCQDSGVSVKYVLSADGTKLYSDAIGDPSSSALVFVHGTGTSSVCFDTIFDDPQFSKSSFLIRYDLRGYGRSGKPGAIEGYSSQKYAEDFAAVVNAFSATKVVFVGWSLGGTVLTDIASHLPPNTILGAVYIASAPAPILFSANTAAVNSLREYFFDPARTGSYELALTLGRMVLIRNAEPGERILEETVKAHDQGTDFLDDNLDVPWKTRCAFLGTAFLQSPAHRLFTMGRLQEHDKVQQLLQEGFPVLEVHGTADGYVSAEKNVGGLRKMAKNLEVRAIEGACHAPFVDKPDEFREAVLEFAQRLQN